MTIAAGSPLLGKLVRLRYRTATDIPLFVQWYTDPDVLYWLGMSEGPVATYESEAARFQATEEDPTRRSWIIETREGKPIGNIGLINLNELHGSAELGISIGDKAYWGRGYGTDAIRTLLEHAFGPLGLRRLWLITDADNERGIRSYEKCGFVREGILREHCLRHGRPLDMLTMAVLKEEAK